MLFPYWSATALFAAPFVNKLAMSDMLSDIPAMVLCKSVILVIDREGMSLSAREEPFVTRPYLSTVTFGYVPAVTPLVARLNDPVPSSLIVPVKPVPALMVVVFFAKVSSMASRVPPSIPARNATTSFHLFMALSLSVLKIVSTLWSLASMPLTVPASAECAPVVVYPSKSLRKARASQEDAERRIALPLVLLAVELS